MCAVRAKSCLVGVSVHLLNGGQKFFWRHDEHYHLLRTSYMALPQGDITGASGCGGLRPSSFVKAGEVGAVGNGDRAQGLPQSLGAAEPPQSMASKGLVVLEPQVAHKAGNSTLVDTVRGSDLEKGHDEAEEGELSVRGGFCLSRSSPPFASILSKHGASVGRTALTDSAAIPRTSRF